MAEKVSQSTEDATALQGGEARNAERAGQRCNRAQGGDLQPGHSMPSGEARRQTAEGDVEQFLAPARAQKASEPLGRGQREGS